MKNQTMTLLCEQRFFYLINSTQYQNTLNTQCTKKPTCEQRNDI